MGFRHRTYSAGDTTGNGALLIYYGGDGTPFVRPDAIASDPTPRRALTLELLAGGSQPAVYLGRPCYHGLQDGCDPGLWTIGRYSEAVVASMAAATERLLNESGLDHVVLVGYSGGGALALLVAERLESVRAVVTIAANLDTDAWTRLHGYSPLETSVNPAAVAGTRGDLVHLHLTGSVDDNVPPSVQQSLRETLSAEAFRTVSGFDHRCCWVEEWPRLLVEVEDHLAR